jgi:hypothetical protein
MVMPSVDSIEIGLHAQRVIAAKRRGVRQPDIRMLTLLHCRSWRAPA